MDKKGVMPGLSHQSTTLSSSRTLTALEASPTLEGQNGGNIYDPDKEWQRNVERWESNYLNQGMFQMWIILFNMGILVLHTIIIFPAPYN